VPQTEVHAFGGTGYLALDTHAHEIAILIPRFMTISCQPRRHPSSFQTKAH